tara:strand:+ start:293 stop:505 length:213 start_codon:yes stop_codon:yes gene_type:complete
MKLKVNGEGRVIDHQVARTTLDLVLKELGYNPKLIVVELNGSIISPKKWDKKVIQDGDILEIVTIVGGGS